MIAAGSIAIAQERSSTDHFVGVYEALATRGIDAAWIPLEERPHGVAAPTKVVAVSDLCSFEVLHVLKQARRAGACAVLLMDGICEYRNTYLNPAVAPDFLRPAPVDVVACAGRVDQERLRDLGNDAVATGLPRLWAIGPSPLPPQPVVLVATAKHPYFNDGERARLIEALLTLRDLLAALGVAVRWRLTAGLEQELDVPLDEAPLSESLASARAVVTTPSTLLIEAMRSGRPTALLHPFDSSLWPTAAWTVDRDMLDEPERLASVIGELLDPSAEQRAQQAEALAEMHQENQPPAETVAELLVQLAKRPHHRAQPEARLDPTRLPPRTPASKDRPRVVSLVRCHLSPVGGVTTWSRRLARAFARHDLGYDLRTLLVVTHPDSFPARLEENDGLTQTCVVNPYADHWEVVETVRVAAERLEPTIVLPNYADLCYAAAMLLRPRGVRTVAIAHTDHPTVHELLKFYGQWDGAIGVSAACMSWLAPLAGERPVSGIVYGVPVADAPRRVEPHGPLKVAYIGRMVEYQKRISDLLHLIDGLEARRVDFEFHAVGDGDHFTAWRRSLAQRNLRHGRVIVHGRRSTEWVQHFLGTIDASVLVSDYEGTSITMLESMGAGVVPAVTDVPSGVDEWIDNGENGIVVPIGEPDLMAQRLAKLAADRPRLAAKGRAAWETVRGRISIDIMARRYRDLFDEVMARPMDRTPADTGLRLCEHYSWLKEWVERPDEAMHWIESRLRESGYRRIALDEPANGCDAVIVRAAGGEPVEERVAEYRARGLGVAVWPHLIEAPVTDRMHRAAQQAVDDGCRRIAIYGIGEHTRRSAGILERGLPFVGFIDDEPPAWPRIYGLPIVPLERALTELEPDAVLLSSDAWEEQLWQRCRPLREAGVRVLPLYGTYENVRQVSA